MVVRYSLRVSDLIEDFIGLVVLVVDHHVLSGIPIIASPCIGSITFA